MKNEILVPDEILIEKIYFIRGQKVMLDRDLALLYGVETKRLKEAVKRNLKRFPEDFMFEMSKPEAESLRPQFASLKRGEHSKYLPYCFTEQGVTMLSCVLNSDRAIKVNIRIIRIFTRLRETLLTHKDILLKLEKLENQVTTNSEDVKKIFTVLRQLIQKQAEPRRKIGFKTTKQKSN